MNGFMRTCMAGIAFAATCTTIEAQQATLTAPMLTLPEAEHLAIEHNPRINIARLLQLAQAQVVREVRSSELPGASANLTAVDSHNGSRITAGGLNNPIVYERAAGGVTISQLITDFGRTHNLVLSAQAQAKAQLQAQRATTADIVLAVDQAFYNALASQAVLKVAEQTVAARQATADEIGALAASKLKSSLDLSFANVELSQARLLLLDAQNAEQDSMANLNALLGAEQDERYTLIDQTPASAQPPPEQIEPMVQDGVQFPSRSGRTQRKLQCRQSIQQSRTCPEPAYHFRTGNRGRYADSRGPDHFVLVWSRWRQREHSNLQRISLLRTRPRSGPSRHGRARRGAVSP